MIVKNEEEAINNCLSSVIDLVDEIIIVDTGSTDKTISICKKYTDKIFSFNWINDFSAARNYSISLAAHPWILVLDADKKIILSDKLSKILQSAEPDVWGYYFERENVCDSKSELQQWTDFVTRLFRNNKIIRYNAPVHEKVDNSILSINKIICKFPGKIEHYSFLNKNNYLVKSSKYIELLKKQIEIFPENYKLYVMLAAEYEKNKMFEYEKKTFIKALGYSKNNPEIHFKLGMLYATHFFDFNSALTHLKSAEKFNSQSYDYKITFPEIFLNISKCLFQLGDLNSSVEYFNKAFKDNHKDDLEIFRFGIQLYDKINKIHKTIYLAAKLAELEDNPENLYSLAVRYLKINNPQKAKKILDMLNQKYPDYRTAAAPGFNI
ncbi:glycosyltransferase [Candidatus Dependentiae bacterium]|nr:glycosyltransferase [Candidatus Dependentiae bacterium]